MTDVPGTSPEHPIIWSPGHPATGSRRCSADISIQNYCIFVFPGRQDLSGTFRGPSGDVSGTSPANWELMRFILKILIKICCWLIYAFITQQNILCQNEAAINLKYLFHHGIMNLICLMDHILLHKSKVNLRIFLRSVKPYEIMRQYKLDYRLQIRTAVATNNETIGECYKRR